MLNLFDELKSNPYPGRGIVVGRDAGDHAVIAYFIMGRSENSRNRVFVPADDEGIKTQAFDPSKMEDPSLIIYHPVRVYDTATIVTNGDQTDTIFDGLEEELEFSQALEDRKFEPDAPNFTPRISAIVQTDDGFFSYEMSILKTDEGDDRDTLRYTYSYENPIPGKGRFIHTYMQDGNPLPSFVGEPKPVEIAGDIDTFTNKLWESLNEENKVSLFVRYIDIHSGKYEQRIINKNQK